MKGMDLSKKYYFECVKPLIQDNLPELEGKYAAALVGYGSDVIGNDDEISRDHEWGPRCHVFLSEEIHKRYGLQLDEILDNNIPLEFEGFPTRFTFAEHWGSIPSKDSSGYHHVVISTPQRFLKLTIGFPGVPGSDIDWLAVSEQRLLEFTSGEVFEDFPGELTEFREKLAYFPDDVWRYRIAYSLSDIGCDDDLISLCGQRGDIISMHLNAARTVEKIMRLVFLLNKQYAPLYPKWLHRNFVKLPEIASEIEKSLLTMLEAREYQPKMEALKLIYERILTFMVNRDLCKKHSAIFQREFSGIDYDVRTSAKDVLSTIRGDLKELLVDGIPLGAIDQWMVNHDIIVSAEHMKSLLPVYKAEPLKREKLDRHI
ncbi:MAG: DUF4037 domain-containing protein [Dehalococcoidales bacterium]|nr:MAG: DUF4037 domain-containing protein [Dehalococcoidales bacterium]